MMISYSIFCENASWHSGQILQTVENLIFVNFLTVYGFFDTMSLPKLEISFSSDLLLIISIYLITSHQEM